MNPYPLLTAEVLDGCTRAPVPVCPAARPDWFALLAYGAAIKQWRFRPKDTPFYLTEAAAATAAEKLSQRTWRYVTVVTIPGNEATDAT
jgi:hypothetical protein